MKLINVKDANDKFVVIKDTEFVNAIGQHAVTLFGMDMTSVASVAKVMRRTGYNTDEKFDVDAFCAQVIAKVPYKSSQKINGS